MLLPDKLTEQMGSVSKKMNEIEAQVDALRVTRESGAGLVEVTLDGHSKMTDLVISSSLIPDEEKRKLVQDLVAAAANLASKEVAVQVGAMRDSMSAHLLNSLGMDKS